MLLFPNFLELALVASVAPFVLVALFTLFNLAAMPSYMFLLAILTCFLIAVAPSQAQVSTAAATSSGATTTATGSVTGTSTSATASTSTPPDVLLNVPNLSVGRIELDVDNLQADINLAANVAGLVSVNAGVAVSVQKINVTITDVEVELE